MLKGLRKAARKFSNIRRRIDEERASRLEKDSKSFVTTTAASVAKIRNIGTIAHIDAGKTTLTERLLHFAGALKVMGEVHDGTALMDFLEQERLRGITIRSACVSFGFRGHQVNLIDTPGHADFNFEVERALRILDGALVILDGGKGVEAQTETVWLQANKYVIPKLCVVNKMDKIGADFEKGLAEVSARFGITVLNPFVPFIASDNFKGIVDIPSNRLYSWTAEVEGETRFHELPFTPTLVDPTTLAWYDRSLEKMVDFLSAQNTELTDLYLSSRFDARFFELLRKGLREAIALRPNKVCLGLPCSALKNKGIHAVLNAIVDYLPAPREPADNQKSLAFVYRSLFDPTRGKLHVLRLFKGDLERTTRLFNVRTGKAVVLGSLFRIHANEFVDIPKAEAGDIVGVQTDAEVLSGDTLLTDLGRASSTAAASYHMVDPLYFACVEFGNRSVQERFLKVIGNYLLEDPSLRYEFDKRNGQHIVKGLGELHVEILLSRLKSDHGIDVTLKKASVALLEMPRGAVEATETFQATIRNQFYYFEVKLALEPLSFEDFSTPRESIVELDIFGGDKGTKFAYQRFRDAEMRKRIEQKNQSIEIADSPLASKPVSPQGQTAGVRTPEKVGARNFKSPVMVSESFTFKNEQSGPIFELNSLDFTDLLLIETILNDSLSRGPLTFSRIANARLRLTGGSYSKSFFGDVALRSAVGRATMRLFDQKTVDLLEPFIAVSINCDRRFSEEIVQDALSRKRGKVQEIMAEGERNTFVIRLPLETSAKYADYLRSLTSGDAKFSFSPSGYSRMSEENAKSVVARRLASGN